MCFCWWWSLDDDVMPSSLMMTTHLANWGKMSFHRNKANNNNAAPGSPAKSPKGSGGNGKSSSKRSLSCAATEGDAPAAAAPAGTLQGVGVKLEPVGGGGSMCMAGNTKHGRFLSELHH